MLYHISSSTVVNAGWRRSRTIWCTIWHTHEHRSYSSLWRLWNQFACKKDWGFELASFTSRMQCLTPAYYENCCHIRMIDRLFDHSQFQWDTKCTDKHWPNTHCPLVFPWTVQNSSAGVSKWDVLWQLSVNINIFGLHILFRSSSFGACLGPFSFIWKCCKKIQHRKYFSFSAIRYYFPCRWVHFKFLFFFLHL